MKHAMLFFLLSVFDTIDGQSDRSTVTTSYNVSGTCHIRTQTHQSVGHDDTHFSLSKIKKLNTKASTEKKTS